MLRLNKISRIEMKIILIGFMASGKSVLGTMLSQYFGIPFYDTDKQIENQTGKSINDIFEQLGEATFREMEKFCIQNLKDKGDFVISVGGGLPCFNNLMDDLNLLGMTIYLDVDFPLLLERLKVDSQNRPKFKDLKEQQFYKLKALYNKRKPVYRKAKYTLKIGDNSENECLDRLIHLVKLHQKDL
jgi:shikimate kinase